VSFYCVVVFIIGSKYTKLLLLPWDLADDSEKNTSGLNAGTDGLQIENCGILVSFLGSYSVRVLH